MVEPLLSRCSAAPLEVDVAGASGRRARDRGGARLRTVLPGRLAVSGGSASRPAVPDWPRTESRPSPRARWKTPLRYRMLQVGQTATCVATTGGRLRRVTCWVPLGKAQSFRQVQGHCSGGSASRPSTSTRPVEASVRPSVTGISWRPTALAELPELARRARRGYAAETAADARYRGRRLEQARQRASYESSAPIWTVAPSKGAGLPSMSRCVKVAGPPQRWQTASSLSTNSATQRSVGIDRTARDGSPARARRRQRARPG